MKASSLKEKLIFLGLFLVLTLSYIISVESDAEKRYEFFYTMSPNLTLMLLVICFIPMKRAWHYLLLSIVALIVISQGLLNLIHASSITIVAPPFICYIFILILAGLLIRRISKLKKTKSNHFS